MFADVADKPPGARLRSARGKKTPVFGLAGTFARTAGCVKVRGVRLNMANNPKKVKDPTEVALSAIQEALNISDGAAADSARSSVHSDAAPTNASSTSSAPAYNESAFDTRPGEDRPTYEPIAGP